MAQLHFAVQGSSVTLRVALLGIFICSQLSEDLLAVSVKTLNRVELHSISSGQRPVY